MAVCNLFKTLTNVTGNFLLFSQYTEDLTRMATHPDVYRVVPARFAVLNIDYSKFNNTSFPNFLQNKFENGCAYARELCGSDPQKEWIPEMSRNLFWNAMISGGLLTYTDNPDQTDTTMPKRYCNELKCVCDINIYNYDKYNEIGYSEIYCFIPNEAKSYYIEDRPGANTPEIVTYDKTYVCGYGEKDKLDPSICDIKVEPNTTYELEARQIFNFEEEGVAIKVNDKEDKFDFNTIVVLYDVYINDPEAGKDEEKLILKHKNIPMGLHICGLIDGKTTTNKITKFVSNPDIYAAGTSYGLRICSRFVALPESGNIKVIDINVNNDACVTSNCIVLGEMAKTLERINALISEKYKFDQTIKELLSIFKNNKTNVPYIVYINKIPYWFVNGSNTGVQATYMVDISNYTTPEINSKLDEFEAKLGY